MRHTAAFILLTLSLAALTGCGTGPTGAQLRAESAARAAQATALIEDAKAADRMATAQAWRPPTLTPEPTATPTPEPTLTPLPEPTATPTPTDAPKPQPITVLVTVVVTVEAARAQPQTTPSAQGAQGMTTAQAATAAFVVGVLLVGLWALWRFVLTPKERIEPYDPTRPDQRN